MLSPHQLTRALKHVGGLVFCLAMVSQPAQAEPRRSVSPHDKFPDKLLDMGTAGGDGLFHHLGMSICAEVNKVRERTSVRCVANPTSGPDYNLQALYEGTMRLGVAFSALSREPIPDSTRLVLTLYDAPVIVIARKGAGVEQIGDIRGKRVEIGSPTSARRLLVEDIVEGLGMTFEDLGATTELNTNKDLMEAFCRGHVDVIIDGYGLPESAYARLVGQCGGNFVQFPEKSMEALILKYPGLTRTTVDVGRYTGRPGEVLTTLDQKVVLVTDKNVGEVALERFLETVLAAATRLRKVDSHMSGFDAESALHGLPNIPNHPAVDKVARRFASQAKASKATP